MLGWVGGVGGTHGELVDEGGDVEAQRGLGSLDRALLQQRVRLHQHAVQNHALGEHPPAGLQQAAGGDHMTHGTVFTQFRHFVFHSELSDGSVRVLSAALLATKRK